MTLATSYLAGGVSTLAALISDPRSGQFWDNSKKVWSLPTASPMTPAELKLRAVPTQAEWASDGRFRVCVELGNLTDIVEVLWCTVDASGNVTLINDQSWRVNLMPAPPWVAAGGAIVGVTPIPAALTA